MFTSAYQLTSVLEVADRLGVRDAWLAAANRCVIASIGPTASETLREEGLTPDLEPSHPKMGHLVKETCEAARELLAAKRVRSAADPQRSVQSCVPHASDVVARESCLQRLNRR